MRINNILNTKEKRRRLRNNMTPSERILWSKLRNDRLGFRFRRQFSIGQYIVDFYCPRKKTVVEVDGIIHTKQKAYDRIRNKFMQEFGIRVIRFTNNDIKNNLDFVLNKIKNTLDRC